MLNLDEIIIRLGVYYIGEPLLIPSTLAIVIAIFYFFGWIINANNWQYQDSDRQSHILHGFFFAVNFIFFPLLAIIGLIYLAEKSGLQISNWLAEVPVWVSLLVIVLILIALEKLDN